MAKIQTVSIIKSAVLSLEADEVAALASLLEMTRGSAMRAAGPLGRVHALLRAAGASNNMFDVYMGADGKMIVSNR